MGRAGRSSVRGYSCDGRQRHTRLRPRNRRADVILVSRHLAGNHLAGNHVSIEGRARHTKPHSPLDCSVCRLHHARDCAGQVTSEPSLAVKGAPVSCRACLARPLPQQRARRRWHPSSVNCQRPPRQSHTIIHTQAKGRRAPRERRNQKDKRSGHGGVWRRIEHRRLVWGTMGASGTQRQTPRALRRT